MEIKYEGENNQEFQRIFDDCQEKMAYLVKEFGIEAMDTSIYQGYLKLASDCYKYMMPTKIILTKAEAEVFDKIKSYPTKLIPQ